MPTLPACTHCGQTDRICVPVYGSSETICTVCAETLKRIYLLISCSQCQTLIPSTKAIVTPFQKFVCPECYILGRTGGRENHMQCAYCGEPINVSCSSTDIYTVVNWCRSEDTFVGFAIYHTACLQDTDSCEDCGNTTRSTGGCVCAFCGSYPPSKIHNYNYIPPLMFLKHDRSCEELFLGIELEITPLDAKNINSEQKALSLLPAFVYAKSDSSIPDGFEVVTHPMSLSWIDDHISQLISLFPKLYELDYRSGDSNMCGTHIHMSRVAFTHLHLYKFLYTVYSNPSLGLLLSQRESSSLTQYATLIDHCNYYIKRARSKSQLQRSRHDAVNISLKNTVELRIFNGTLNPLAFMKNINTAVCLYNYTNAVSLHGISIKSLLQYVKDNAHIYPYLDLFLSVDADERVLIFGLDSGPQTVSNIVLTHRIKRLYTACTGVKYVPTYS